MSLRSQAGPARDLEPKLPSVMPDPANQSTAHEHIRYGYLRRSEATSIQLACALRVLSHLYVISAPVLHKEVFIAEGSCVAADSQALPHRTRRPSRGQVSLHVENNEFGLCAGC